MENKQQQKKKRFYKAGQIIWAIELKKEVEVKSVNREELEITVLENKNGEIVEHTFPLWSVDVLKYKAKEKFFKDNPEKAKKGKLDKLKDGKITYFSSVNGGVIPTKEVENAGRDCYARLEPIEREGKQIYELHLPQLKLTKIPLGFASYLELDDVLSLKHERSSVGGTGLINVSGLIDATYQGEVILQVVPLVSDIVITSEVEEKYFDEKINTYFVPYKRAIAQAVVFKLSEAKDVHIPYQDLLDKPSTRGTGGWGSTGK